MATNASQRQEPRISVNDLALFMVSSDTARLGIIRRNKNPTKPPIIRYRDARPPVIAFLTDMNRKVQHLVTAQAMFSQRASDPSQSTLRQDDARQSIEVLQSLQAMANQLGGISFTAAPNVQSRMVISSVSVSSRLDLYVHGAARSVNQIGGAIIRMTQDDAETDTARAKRREMGIYVATIARRHLESNLKPSTPVASKLCMAIDIRHGEVFAAPSANARRMTDIENACVFIAAIWPNL